MNLKIKLFPNQLAIVPERPNTKWMSKETFDDIMLLIITINNIYISSEWMFVKQNPCQLLDNPFYPFNPSSI